MLIKKLRSKRDTNTILFMGQKRKKRKKKHLMGRKLHQIASLRRGAMERNPILQTGLNFSLSVFVGSILSTRSAAAPVVIFHPNKAILSATATPWRETQIFKEL